MRTARGIHNEPWDTRILVPNKVLRSVEYANICPVTFHAHTLQLSRIRSGVTQRFTERHAWSLASLSFCVCSRLLITVQLPLALNLVCKKHRPDDHQPVHHAKDPQPSAPPEPV